MKEKIPVIMKRRAKLSGSYTVEISLLMAVILPVLICILNTSFFLCDSVRMMAVMQEKARIKLEGSGDVTADGFFRLHPDTIQVESGPLKVKASASDIPDRQVMGEVFEGEITISRRHPQTWIRMIRKLQAEED